MKRTLFLLTPIFLIVIGVFYYTAYRKTRSQTIVYQAPGADTVRVEKDLIYLPVDDERPNGDTARAFDLYLPPEPSAQPLPVVVLVHPDGPASVIDNFKDWGQMTSWARTFAASGLAAVTFNRSSTELLKDIEVVAAEVEAMLAYLQQHGERLGIDPQRIGIWANSSAPPFALRAVLRDRPANVRAIAIYYGAVSFDAFPAVHTRDAEPSLWHEFDLARHLGASGHLDPPSTDAESGPVQDLPAMLVAIAGKDTPELNTALTNFIDAARAHGGDVTVLEHPEGDHAFDLGSDTDTTRNIVRQTIEFFQHHLTEARG